MRDWKRELAVDLHSATLFNSGLLLQPNGHDHGSEANQEKMLATAKDHIQVGLAANLRDFVLPNSEGMEVKGSVVLTHDGTPVAYALCPIETINYISAHDNETLFDIVSMKTPMDISVDERCRINHLANSIIALSQLWSIDADIHWLIHHLSHIKVTSLQHWKTFQEC